MGEGSCLIGEVFVKDEDGNYSKVGDLNEIQKVISFMEDNSYELYGSKILGHDDSTLSVTFSGKLTGFRKFERLFKYGWKTNGPVRKKLLDRAIRLRYRVKEMTT